MKCFKCEKGFTVTELIIVLAIISILAAIAIPTYINVINKAKYEADNATVTILNNATAAYASMGGLEMADVFTGISDDGDKMEFLSQQNYLSEVPEPAQDGTVFVWLDETALWAMQGGADDGESTGDDG